MRLVQLSAGTGSFYCGTCIRDNALVVELRRQGHDALLVPMYLPLTLDEQPATPEAPLFYGGVNVYLQQKSALFRHTPRWVDRLLDAPGLLKAAGSRAGATSAGELGDLTLSMLRGEEGQQAKELERLADWLAGEFQPDVVALSNVLLIGVARRIRERTGATILCFLNGEDGFLDSLPEADRKASWAEVERRAVDVDAFLPVSHWFAERMRERAGLPAERVHVVYPGILLEGYDELPAAPPPCAPPALGYLARLCPMKGLGTLIDAYLLLRKDGKHDNLHLRLAGTCTAADDAYVAGLRERLAQAGVSEEVEFFPNLDREAKIEFLRELTVFSVPATYGEAFGLYVAEAMAAGVPVVQPRHAAFPEIIEMTGGGVLCEPDDPASLAAQIEALFADPATAKAMGERGRQAAFDRFSVERMAAEVLDLVERVRPAHRSPAAGQRVA